MDTAPFESLLDRYQSGEASKDELGELDRQLRADASKRRRLVERTLLEVHLRKFFRGLAPSPPRRRASPDRRFDRRWLIVAASLATICLLLFAGLLRNAGGPEAAVESGLVRVNNVATAVVPTQVPFEVGGRIPAVLRLTDGAHAELDVGTRAVLHGVSGDRGRRIELRQGGGSFTVARGQAALRVETPAATVAAESAQFTARLSGAANGATVLTVNVGAGTVEVEAGGQIHMLAAGAERAFTAPAGP